MLDYSEDEFQESPFVHLPEEMFLHICSFLDVKDITVSLSRVCRKFYYILQAETIWRSRIAARWNRQYPIVQDYVGSIDWKKACYALENECKLWLKKSRNAVTNEGHLSDVDALLFIDGGLKCLTGSRDRHIMIWDLSGGHDPVNIGKYCTHDGWIWRLKKFGDNIYSTSWDRTIKMWDYNVDLKMKQQFKCNAAVVSIAVDQSGLIYGGCFNRIYAFDPRSKNEPLFTLEPSITPILTIDELGNDLVSGCESQSLIVWDVRQRKLKQTVKLPRNNYPVCSQVLNDLLYIGDRMGNIRLYGVDANSLVEKSVINIGFNKPITGLNVTPGSVVASCDTLVKVFLPLKPILPIVTLKSTHGTICGMHSRNGRVAIGTASKVEFYLPDETI